MTGTLVLWLALAGQVDNATAAAASESPQVSQPALTPFRTGHDLRDAARDAFQRWNKPKPEENEQAAKEFLILYHELQADREMADAERERLRTKVRSRLQSLSTEIGYRVAVKERHDRESKKDQPEQLALPEGQGENLGQQAGVAQFNAGVNVQPGTLPQGIPDSGRELVDLIQHVIAPQSWDVNGGPGSIYYWAPGHAIVVSQTDEVHHRLGDALNQLRRAGN